MSFPKSFPIDRLESQIAMYVKLMDEMIAEAKTDSVGDMYQRSVCNIKKNTYQRVLEEIAELKASA